jgi:hypothetical protein
MQMANAFELKTDSLVQQVSDFYEIGYFVVRGLYSRSEVADISRSFDNLQNIALKLKTTQIVSGSQLKMDASIGLSGWALPNLTCSNTVKIQNF